MSLDWPRGLVGALLAFALVACGGDGAGDDVEVDAGLCPGASADRYLPLAIGASWTYDNDDQGTLTSKTTVVEALEDVGDRKQGIVAYRLTTTTSVTGERVVAWQEDRCTSVVRHRKQDFASDGTLLRERVYVPSKMRIDESLDHLQAQATYAIAYTEILMDPIRGTTTTSEAETWTVLATNEVVTVPAGTFTCLKLQRERISAGSTEVPKLYWFAPGIGKIQETGEETETLTAYSIP